MMDFMLGALPKSGGKEIIEKYVIRLHLANSFSWEVLVTIFLSSVICFIDRNQIPIQNFRIT